MLFLLPTLAFATNLRTIELSESTTINFNSKFTSSFVAKKQMEVMSKCSANPGSELTLVLYTPGGSVSAGQLFFDTVKALPCKINTITIFAASMGYQTVQNLGKRYILPSGILMSHRAYISGLSGEIGGELDNIYSLLKGNVFELDKIAASRVGLSVEEYQLLIRDELWMTGPQSVNMKHADEVVLAKCDGTLKGTYTEQVNTIFGPLDIVFSKCPLVTGIIEVKMATREEEEYLFNYYNNITKHVTMEL